MRISDCSSDVCSSDLKTYIGTPHTHDSIYPERIAGGAAVLKIPLFEHVKRYTETRQKLRYRFDFDPADDGLYVMVGIHTGARMLVEGVDYRVEGREVVFPTPPGGSAEHTSELQSLMRLSYAVSC